MAAFEYETGSISDISRRLILWGQRSDRGMARVEYSSEFARQQVTQQLQAALSEVGIAYREISLTSQPSADRVVADLLDRLMQSPTGVVSIVGFGAAFANQSTLADDLRVLNFNRERFLAFPGRQIWWVTPVFLQRVIHAIPDLNSYFSPRLCLSEVTFADSARDSTLLTTGSTVNIEDARQRSQQLIRQFEAARRGGAKDDTLLTTYLLPALGALAEVGAQQELRDLTQQFEGLLGSLKRTDSPDMATSLGRLASLYHDQGRYSEAKPLYLQALEIWQRQLGEDHPFVATSLNNLAGLCESQGRYSEAESLYLQALEIWQRQLGEDHPDVVTSLNNLAGLYKLQGRYSEAEPLCLQTLAIRQRQLGDDHPDVATSLNNLAGLYESQGRYSEAEPLYLQTLAIFQRQLGENHPNVATSLNNLAHLYNSQGRYNEAEPLYLQALATRQCQLGDDHPDVATSLNNLAELYDSQERYSEAEPLYLQALDICQRQLGDDHPDVATSLNNLAHLYKSQGRYNEAEPLYLRAVPILFKKLGADHPNTKTGLQNFLMFLQKALQENRIAELSDDPMTRSLLQQLQDASD